jgi:beta-N-acetylhexosaminidase
LAGAAARLRGLAAHLAARLRGLSRFDQLRIVLVALALGVLTVALLDTPADDAPVGEAGGRGARDPEQRSFLARMIPPTPGERPKPREGGSIEELVAGLPVERKVAQLFLMGFDGPKPTGPTFAMLERVNLGGIVIEANNYRRPKQVRRLGRRAASAAGDRDPAMPFVMAPQDGGKFSAIEDVPPNRAPADLPSPEAGATGATATAKQLRELGINGILAPVLDVGAAGGPLGKRAYSDDPDRVTEYARATGRALERTPLFWAPKHFPGLGAASQSPEEGPANVGLTPDQLAQRDLPPFEAAIAAGAPAILVGHGLYPTDDFVVPASQSSAVIGELLRARLGFEGVAIADDLSSPAITATTSVPDAAVASLRAGADMAWIRGPRGAQEGAYLAALNAVQKGEISRARLDEAVLRVLSAKDDAGLIR